MTRSRLSCRYTSRRTLVENNLVRVCGFKVDDAGFLGNGCYQRPNVHNVETGSNGGSILSCVFLGVAIGAAALLDWRDLLILFLFLSYKGLFERVF